MIKRVLWCVVQFGAFLGLLAVGGNWDVINLGLQMKALQNHTKAFNPMPVVKYAYGADHIFIADGLIFATALLVLIVLVELLRRRVRPWVGVTVLAYVLALGTAFVLRMGRPV